jgi:hypothetical protein
MAELVSVPLYKTRNLAVDIDPGARTILPGTNVSFSTDPITGDITINVPGALGGTVTSVNIANATGITFTGGPITTSGVFTPALSTNLQGWSGIAPASKANDSAVVHLAGTETITGAKTFNVDINLGQVASLVKVGSLTGTQRLLASSTNTDTSSTSSVSIALKAGSGIGANIGVNAPEYTVLPQFTGKLSLESMDAGIAYSANSASGTHTWYTGVARNLMMTLDNAGALTVVGNITGSAFVGPVLASASSLTVAGVGIDFRPNGLFGATLGSFDTAGNLSDALGNVRDVPQVVHNGSFSFALTDKGKHCIKTNSTAATWTIPTNASVAFPIGSVITIINLGGSTNNITVSPAGGVGLYQNGASGAIAVAPGSMITIIKIATNTWQA